MIKHLTDIPVSQLTSNQLRMVCLCFMSNLKVGERGVLMVPIMARTVAKGGSVIPSDESGFQVLSDRLGDKWK